MREFIEKLIERLRKEAEEHREHWKKFVDDDSFGGMNATMRAIKIVNELAEEYESNLSESLTSWIPVTERLPKYDVKSEYYEEVIVTLDDGRVTVGCYRNLDEEWWVNAESGTKHAIDATGHVIAWQPLPALFRTEKAEWKDKVMNHFTKIE